MPGSKDNIPMPPNAARVSIIMLTYNRASLITESINSVLQQTFKDYELLVIDDGSTDGTKDVIKQIQDERIKYFFAEHRGNIPSLKNFAFARSRGEFIAFIDSDDLWQKDKIEKQVTILDTHPDVGITFSDVELFNNDGVIKRGIYHSLKKDKSFYRGSIFNFLISNRMAIYPSSIMYRKDCQEKTGLYDERLGPIQGDNNFKIRLSFLFNAYVVFDCWTRIRKHGENTSQNQHESSFHEMEQTITHYYNSGGISKKTYHESLLSLRYALALDYWRRKDFKSSRRELMACLRMHPFYLKPGVRYILSYFK